MPQISFLRFISYFKKIMNEKNLILYNEEIYCHGFFYCFSWMRIVFEIIRFFSRYKIVDVLFFYLTEAATLGSSATF